MEPQTTPQPTPDGAEPRRILVVANQTACGDELLAVLEERMRQGPCHFTLLVPATPPAEHATWTEGEAKAARHAPDGRGAGSLPGGRGPRRRRRRR